MPDPPNPIILRPHRPGDIGHVVHRHGVVYFEDYGWDERFEATVAQILADFIEHYDPKMERSWIAERDGEFLGCVFLAKDRDLEHTARIRAVLVERSARGMGLGRQLVHTSIQFARNVGYRNVVLSTQSILTTARKIYKEAGFRMIEEKQNKDYMQNSRGETWMLEL